MNLNYRITKYDPNKRNQEGHFLDNSEWTSISDVGNPEYRSVSFAEYEKTEKAYVESIRLILVENNIQNLQIDALELYDSEEDFETYKKDGRLENIEVDFKNEIAVLKDGAILNLTEVIKVIPLILRETIWMNLVNPNLKVSFGYDYYMYVHCPELSRKTIIEIENMGLFVEPNTEHQTIIITDGNEN